MTPEQWHRVKEVFEAALGHAPEERSAFLGQACGGDDLLCSEVKSLLSSYEQEKSFLETPAAALAAQSLVKEDSTALVGQKLGHHQIIREIGRGGMGVVYLAQDISLGRPVALKFLPKHLTSDPNRLTRFEREARAASALNHPNILTIHEIGQLEGLHFIATEFIDGVTLREHIRGRQLELKEALNIAEQIASAFVAAHEAGIVHRDIKPENVMLRRDGYVKVLDFGLAKLTEQEAVEVIRASAVIAGMNTDTGVMGTVGYMSPEQAQGMSVDRRTDIFSLGVVIYEMVTGRVPFETRSPGDVIVPIAEQEPAPLDHFLPEVPAELQVIVNKALRKNREERYQAVTELLVDLKSVRSGPSKKRGLAARRVGFLIAALALMISVAVWQRFARTSPGNAPRTDSLGRSAAMKTTPLTDLPGMEADPAFSPDESEVAFGWAGEANDNVDIYVKPLDGGNLRRLTNNPALDSGPVWSPDGHAIAFIRYSDKERAIFTIPAIGGSERRLISANVLSLPDGRAYIDWSPDGKSLVYSDASAPNRPFGIFRLSAETLEREQLTSAPEHWVGDQRPVYSPTGQMLAFVRAVSVDANNVADIYVIPATGGEPKRLTFDNQYIEGLAWTPDGRSIVFSSNRGGLSGLWQISATGGEPQPLGIGGDNALLPAISNQGRLLAYVKHFRSMSMWRVDLQSSSAETSSLTRLLSTTTQNYFPKISPDGKRIVFSSSRSGAAEIWACDADGSNMLQLTRLGRPETGSPRWSPDGRFIAFDTRLKEPSDIYVIGSDGGPSRRLTEDPDEDVLPSWSQDGRAIYFGSDRSGDFQVWKVSAEGGDAVQVTQHGGFEAFESPDGKYVYYVKRDAIGLWRVPSEGGKETPVLDHCHWSRWSVADKGIYFARPVEKAGWVLEFFSFETRRLMRVAAIDKEPAGGLGVSPDGRWLVYAQTDSIGMNIMMVENFR